MLHKRVTQTEYIQFFYRIYFYDILRTFSESACAVRKVSAFQDLRTKFAYSYVPIPVVIIHSLKKIPTMLAQLCQSFVFLFLFSRKPFQRCGFPRQ